MMSTRDEYPSRAEKVASLFTGKGIKIAAAAVGTFLLADASTTMIPANQVGVITRFKAVDLVVQPGLHLKVPFFESVYEYPSKLIITEAVPEDEGPKDSEGNVVNPGMLPIRTADSQNLMGEITLHWTLKTKSNQDVVNVHTNYQNYEQTMRKLLLESIQVTFGQINLVDVSKSREAINDMIEQNLQRSIDQSGYPFKVKTVIFNKLTLTRAAEAYLTNTFKASQQGNELQFQEENAQRQAHSYY
jgi:regulator of protease activity HflC (stomatin/prohibitin superfamily)